MSEKMFTLSKDYQKLWALLTDGATVVYQVEYLPCVRETGLIDKSMCHHIPMSIRYADEDGLKAWRDIDPPTFVSECERLNLQFFDESEAPELEPDMFWLVDDADEPLSLKHLIDAADSDDGAAIEVYCAKSMPNRKIRAWREGDGVEHRVCWEWINETSAKSTHS